MYSLSRRQRGAVLAVAIALLAIMTVAALAMNEVTKLQARQTNGLLSRDAAFELAEEALRTGELSLVNPGTECNGRSGTSSDGQIGQGLDSPPTDVGQTAREWWLRHATRLNSAAPTSGITSDAYYLTALQATTSDAMYFAVTARSQVGRRTTVLQSIYAIPLAGTNRTANTCGRQSWIQLK